jgi:hypothetical protein
MKPARRRGGSMMARRRTESTLLGAESPVASWTRGASKTPTGARGGNARSALVRFRFVGGSHTGGTGVEERTWKLCTNGSPVSMSARDAMGRAGRTRDHRRWKQPTGCPMPQPNGLSRSLAAVDQDSTLIAVIEMSRSTWLVAGIVPGINRQPLKKLAADEMALLQLLYRWRDEATKAGRTAKAGGGRTSRQAAHRGRRAAAAKHAGRAAPRVEPVG